MNADKNPQEQFSNEKGNGSKQHSQQNHTENSTAPRNNYPKVSNNFGKLNKQPIKPLDTNDPNPRDQQPTANNTSKPELIPEPAPFTVIQSYATKLKMNQARNETPIELTKPQITTRQGLPAVIFRKEDFMVKLGNSCKYTLIGKFSSTMHKVELIRKNSILQTPFVEFHWVCCYLFYRQLSGGVKIAHFNARHVYIDLDNEAGYITAWTKQKMHIDGQLMRIQAWTLPHLGLRKRPLYFLFGLPFQSYLGIALLQ